MSLLVLLIVKLIIYKVGSRENYKIYFVFLKVL